ncbi:MAG: patatin-like phospholipase family protein [Acidobacteria bacterium]|nr:patatin-like phospholipase family protein [Acidobacteriota bacterium]
MKDRYPKVGLALSGGAARGLAHIGVLKVLDEYKIPIHYIAATSVGSIIGAAYAARVPITNMIKIAETMRWRDLGSVSFRLMGLSDSSRMEKFLRGILPVATFEELEIPLQVTATNLTTGELIVFKQGDLFRAIRSSCALPWVYAPVDVDGVLVADGGLTMSIPCRVVKDMGADIILAVDIRGNLSAKIPRNMFQVVMQSMAILGYGMRDYQVQEADLVIAPDVNDIGWDELARAKEAIAAGEKEARLRLSELLKIVKPNFYRWLGSIFRG